MGAISGGSGNPHLTAPPQAFILCCMKTAWSLRTVCLHGPSLSPETLRTPPDVHVVEDTLPPDPSGVLLITTPEAPRRWQILGYVLEHRTPLLVIGSPRLAPFTQEVFIHTGLVPQAPALLKRSEQLIRTGRLSQQFLSLPRTGGTIQPGSLLDVLLLLLDETSSFVLRVWDGQENGEIAGRDGWILRARGGSQRGHAALLWILSREAGVWSLRRNVRVRTQGERFRLLDALLDFTREVLETSPDSLAL